MNNEGMVCHIKGHIRTGNISELNNEGGGGTEEIGESKESRKRRKKVHHFVIFWKIPNAKR